jgi:hypothetical protein
MADFNILSELGGSSEAAFARQLRLSSQPTLVVLLRHLACNCSTDRLVEAVAALRASGLAGRIPVLIVLSSPSAAMAAQLLREDAALLPVDAARLRLSVLLDPSRAVFQRLRCTRGVTSTLCFSRQRAAFNLLGLLAFPYQALCRGRVPGVSSGDPWQLGGAFLIAPGGEELYAMREVKPGWPPIDFSALARAAAAAGVGSERDETAKRQKRRRSGSPGRRAMQRGSEK